MSYSNGLQNCTAVCAFCVKEILCPVVAVVADDNDDDGVLSLIYLRVLSVDI